MKKVFFGYDVSEVDVILDTLREENESLNATITALKAQIKNNEAGGAKVSLLESDLKDREAALQQLTEEKIELKYQVSSLTAEYGILNDQNTELMRKIELLHTEKENLNLKNFELQQQLLDLNERTDHIDTSLLETLQLQLQNEKEYRAVLEEALNSKSEELTAATLDLEETKSSYETPANDFEKEKVQEVVRKLELAQAEIDRLKDALAIANLTINEQDNRKTLEKKPQANINIASEISVRAYYDMSKLRNEVIEYMQEQLKEYYQSVNENSVKMRASIEQRQAEYNQMVREFFTKASDFRVSLSSMEDKYSDMADYSMNIDKLSSRMNEIMNQFIEESGACLKSGESEPLTEKESNLRENYSYELVEKSNNKHLVLKASGQ